MAITRTRLEFEKHFVQIPNGWMRDKRISRRARGLLAEIMTHDVGWSLTVESLVANGPEGRDVVRKIVIELEAAGYLRRKRQKDERGRFGGVDYILQDPAGSEDKAPESVENVPMTEYPTLDNSSPMTENATLENPTAGDSPLRTPSLKENQEKEYGGETFMGTSPADFGKETPWNDLHGGGLEPADRPAPELLHKDRCAFHQGAQFPPPCRGCQQARKALDDEIRADHHARVIEERRQRAAAVAARRAAAADCLICDDDGYAGTVLCLHDPEHQERVKRGVELVRNSLAQK